MIDFLIEFIPASFRIHYSLKFLLETSKANGICVWCNIFIMNSVLVIRSQNQRTDLKYEVDF